MCAKLVHVFTELYHKKKLVNEILLIISNSDRRLTAIFASTHILHLVLLNHCIKYLIVMILLIYNVYHKVLFRRIRLINFVKIR